MKQDSVFIKLLKKHTNIDRDFIDTFFKKFKIGGELDFDIEDKIIANYFGIKLKTLRTRLQNGYAKKEIYVEGIDYKKVKHRRTNSVTYMVNYKCFENLAMTGETEESNTVREYFIKLREFIRDNQHLIYQAIENKKRLHKYRGFDSIYFFAAKKNSKIFKIGKSKDIVMRLSNYNIGRIDDVDLEYYALVSNQDLIETCIKDTLKTYQKIKGREIYQVDPKLLKRVVYKCYKNNISKEDNLDLYQEISNLLGMYVYIKNNPQIKPYVIIGKNIN